MKILSVFLILLLLAACGPSAQEIAATADAAQAQTETAAPTLTFTATSTPTQTPTPTQTLTPTATMTFTPSPTPSIPKIIGNFQINFISVDETTIIPEPPHEIEVVLNKAGQKFIISAFDTEGNFVAYLEQGRYTIQILRIKNQALDREFVEIITEQKDILVPSLNCSQAGAITFTITRLPPGSYDEQLEWIQKVSRGAPVLFRHLETGGVLMPSSTRISGAGALCPETP
ncbi:MAG TPA: hypothetical protein PLF42_10520 [Anaerolineales bacterium]|nr:hypothetical protein [Anaerolineales bacterium]